MTEFSVNTRNRFALGLDDEEDTDLYELLEKEAEQKKQRAKEAEEAAKNKAANKGKKDKRNTTKSNTKKVNTKPVDNSSNPQTQQTSNDNTATKKSYPRNDENRPPRLRNNRPAGGSGNVDNFEKPPRDFENGRERRGGYGGNYRGRGGRGAFGNRPRREFERHSGSDKTGVKAVEKKDGLGNYNWGDEIQSQLDQPADQQAEMNSEQNIEGSGEADATADGATTPVEGEAAETEQKEAEKPQMTLEEYKAKNPKNKVVYGNVRKANEGTDTRQWKKTVALERKKKGDHSDDEYEEYTDDEDQVEDAKSDLEKLQIQITFGDRRGRGGRGRGFGPRGGNRGFSGSEGQDGYRGDRGGYDKRSRGKHHVPAVDNEKDFPMLGSR